MQSICKLAVFAALMLMSLSVHAGVKKAKSRSKNAPGILVLVVPVLAPEPVRASPWTVAIKTGGYQTGAPHSEAAFAAGANLEYGFYKSYAAALDISYGLPTRYLQSDTWFGWNDISLTLTDKELWTNPAWGLTLKGTLGGTIPYSEYSKVASMQYGTWQQLNLKKTITDRFSVSYLATLTEYSWNYETAQDDEKDTIYNTQFTVTNRVNVSYDILKKLHWNSGTATVWYHNTANENFMTWIINTGLSYDMADWASLDLGVRSTVKRDEDKVWNGPVSASRAFAQEGMIFMFGMGFKI